MKNIFLLIFVFFFSHCIVVPVYNYEEIWIDASSGVWVTTDDTVDYGASMLGVKFKSGVALQVKDGAFSIEIDDKEDESVRFSLYKVAEQVWSIYKIEVAEDVYYTSFRFRSVSNKTTLYVSVEAPRSSPEDLTLPTFNNTFLRKVQ